MRLPVVSEQAAVRVTVDLHCTEAWSRGEGMVTMGSKLC